MIRTTYDPEADVLNVQFGAPDAESDGHQEVAPGVYAEFDKAGNVIGVESTCDRLPDCRPPLRMPPSKRPLWPGSIPTWSAATPCGQATSPVVAASMAWRR